MTNNHTKPRLQMLVVNNTWRRPRMHHAWMWISIGKPQSHCALLDERPRIDLVEMLYFGLHHTTEFTMTQIAAYEKL